MCLAFNVSNLQFSLYFTAGADANIHLSEGQLFKGSLAIFKLKNGCSVVFEAVGSPIHTPEKCEGTVFCLPS